MLLRAARPPPAPGAAGGAYGPSGTDGGRHLLPGRPGTVTFTAGGDTPAFRPGSGPRPYGTRGTLVGQRYGASTVSRRPAGEAAAQREALPVPPRLTDALPPTGNLLVDKGAALARDFRADIRGEAPQPYLTCYDGWRYQEAIDARRAGRGWYDLPS